MAKVSDKKKVEQLEKCVLDNDYEELKEVLEEYSDFEFLARALGLACRFRSLDMVKLLVEHGATFSYETSATIKSKYGMATQTATGEYYVDYAILLCLRDFNEDRRVGKITAGLDGIYTIARLNQMPVNSEQERVTIIEYLLSEDILTDLQKENLLYQAILNRQGEIVDYLQSTGATISASDDEQYRYGYGNMERFHCRYEKAMTGSDNIFERQELQNCLERVSESEAESILSRLITILKEQGKKLKVTKGLLNALPAQIFTSKYLDQIDLDSIPAQILLERAMQDNNEAFLDYLLKQGIKISSKLAQSLVTNAEGKFKSVFEDILSSEKPKTTENTKKGSSKTEKKSILDKGDNRTDEQKAAQFGYRTAEDGNITITKILDESLYKKMIIPESIYGAKVTSIGIPYLDKTVKSLYIPATVTAIDFNTSRFQTPNIAQTEISPENQAYSTDGECLFTKDGKTLLSALHTTMTEYTVPDGVELIDYDAFKACTRLKKVVFPRSLTEIRSEFGEKVETIEGGENIISCRTNDVKYTKWFENAGGILLLGKVLLKVENQGRDQDTITIPVNVQTIGEGVFEGPLGYEQTKEVIIPGTVRVIGKNAFSYRKFTKLVISEGVEEIGYFAFNKCENLESVIIPSTVKHIHGYAFAACKNLKSVTIPDTEVEISQYAFNEYCGEKIAIGSKPTVMDEGANLAIYSFSEGSGITGENVIDEDGTVFNSDRTELIEFSKRFSGKEYIVPDSVRVIKRYAFASANIESVILPNSVEVLEEKAFSGYSCSLKRIQMSKGLKTIGLSCFEGSKITTVEFFEGLETIEDRAFYGVYLDKVTIPRTVKTIGLNCFAGTKEIVEYNSLSLPEDQLDNARFIGCSAKGNSYFPTGMHSHVVTVKDANSDEVIYRVYAYGDNGSQIFGIAKAWKNYADYDNAYFDAKYPDWKFTMDQKIDIAVGRLSYPVDLSDSAKDMYQTYLSKNTTSILKRCIERNDLGLIRTLEKLGTCNDIKSKSLVEYANTVGNNNIELIAYLMELGK